MAGTTRWHPVSLPAAAKAGDHNALGRYKFYLPNNDAIYLHSTPRKSPVRAGARAFSSGCIRVEHADDLAELLLADSRYQPDKVANILKDPDQVAAAQHPDTGVHRLLEAAGSTMRAPATAQRHLRIRQGQLSKPLVVILATE